MKAIDELLKENEQLKEENKRQGITIKKLESEIKYLRKRLEFEKTSKYEDIRKAVKKARERQFVRDVIFDRLLEDK